MPAGFHRPSQPKSTPTVGPSGADPKRLRPASSPSPPAASSSGETQAAAPQEGDSDKGSDSDARVARSQPRTWAVATAGAGKPGCDAFDCAWGVGVVEVSQLAARRGRARRDKEAAAAVRSSTSRRKL